MSTVTTAELSVEEFSHLPDHKSHELINGHLVEQPMSPENAFIAGEIYSALRAYLKINPIGIAFPDGAGYTLRAGEQHQVRKPDVSVVLWSRLPGGRIPSSRFEFSPDVAVEVVSPSDVLTEVESKIEDYLEAGTQLVWLVRPRSRRVTVIRGDRSEVSLGQGEVLTGEPVLPGFRLEVATIFPPAGTPARS